MSSGNRSYFSNGNSLKIKVIQGENIINEFHYGNIAHNWKSGEIRPDTSILQFKSWHSITNTEYSISNAAL